MRFLQIYLYTCVCIVLFGVAVTAQIEQDDELLEIDTQLIDVPIVVTDSVGKLLTNLNRNNFVLYEDGKPQEIANFSTTEAPFEVALLLDTSGSTRSELSLIKRSAAIFINSLRSGDRVSIIAFNSQVESISRTNLIRKVAIAENLIELTDDREKLNEALANVQTSEGTPYYDGLVQVVEKVFKNKATDKFRGRRALVALTDGVDSTSGSDFLEVQELINDSGITSYFIQIDTRENFESNLTGDCETSVRFSKRQIRRYYDLFGKNSKIEKNYNFCRIGDFTKLDMSKRLYELADRQMRTLAKSSGGKVFPVASLSGSRTAFRKVATEIGKRYSLGYYPSNEKRDGTYRQIKVQIKGLPKGTKVRARQGYTAPRK